MKKIFSFLTILGFLAVSVAPLAVSTAAAAEDIPSEINKCILRHDLTGTAWTSRGFTCPAKTTLCAFDSTNYTCGSCCMIDTVYTITDWIFVFLVALSAIWILLGAFYLLTAVGDPEKIKKGRDYIMYAAIGLIVALLAKAIPGIAKTILGF